MAIKITVSNQVAFKVRGSINDETGAAQAFDFDLIARRLGSDALQAALEDGQRKIPEFLSGVITGWRRVLDDDGAEVLFSPEGLNKLFQIPGLPALAFRQYLAEAGAKEKN